MRISDWSSDVCSSDLWAGQNVQPRPYPNRTPFDPNGHHGIKRRCPIRQIPRIGVVNLPPVAIDFLAQITIPACESQEHHRQLEVGAGPGGIAGEHAERSEEHTYELQSLMRISF